MKAITIKQPWAGAIFASGKDVENRSWSTKYRGPLLIHAGAGFSNDDPDLVKKAERAGDTGPWTPSALLGVVELVDCVWAYDSEWAQPSYWHWVLRNPQPLSKPIPMRGKLGLWNVPLAKGLEDIVEGRA